MWGDCCGEYLSAAGCAAIYVSGLSAGFVWRLADFVPRPAMATVIATQVLTVVHILKNFVVYSRANRKADKGERILEGQEGFRQTL